MVQSISVYRTRRDACHTSVQARIGQAAAPMIETMNGSELITQQQQQQRIRNRMTNLKIVVGYARQVRHPFNDRLNEWIGSTFLITEGVV